jgi:beta-carotene 3-hydroxylase
MLIGVICGLVAMEVVSYVVHRYLFHGVLWRVHQTHHRRRPGRFELNDVFSGFFALISIGLLALGSNSPLSVGLGLGMSLYGLLYFALHDVLTHRRFGLGRGWAARLPPVVTRLATEHRKHHRSADRRGVPPFGFLL